MYGNFTKVITNENAKAVERLVNILNPDHIAWEKYARAHNIDPSKAPMLGVTYRAFAALRRAGDITQKFDEFSASVLEIIPTNQNGTPLELKDGQLVDPEDTGDILADPTQ